MKYKYEFADYSVKNEYISYYTCLGCRMNTFTAYRMYKTQNGSMCKECVEYLERIDADFAIGLGVST